MWRQRILELFILGCVLQESSVTGLWSCSADAECSSLSGGVCRFGDCVCPFGQQPVLGGSLCVDAAPYLTSSCVEDHQCSRLSVAFECRRHNDSDQSKSHRRCLTAGNCFCQPNHHYFLGRCWPTRDYGNPCTTSEECMSVIRDPYSLTCNVTCQCAEGYYERQRGECRKIGYVVGDGCVLNADCQFEGGACDPASFTCYSVTSAHLSEPISSKTTGISNWTRNSATSRQNLVECDTNNPCSEPFLCSSFGVCHCPVGYYGSEDGSMCYAELGSPSTEEQCVGILAEVRNGICSCPPNFFFEENMRDCVKVSRTITDSCTADSSCFTFGAASVCGEEQPPWGLRSCACDQDIAVWDSNQQMCRLFAGIGEYCEVDSDCLAGNLEIQCVVGGDGQGYCACPEGYTIVDGLCLTTGLQLGDTCQATQECSGTPNAVCEDSRCTCDSASYQEIDGSCAPIIGGICELDSDCVIENTMCSNSSGASLTCQCQEQFVASGDACWPVISSISPNCNVSAQCQQLLGEASSCSDHTCSCNQGHHHRDGGCWPITGLFEACTRSSQCFLSDASERTVCRNSICQCEFHYPYSEEQNTCTSSASNAVVSIVLLAVRFALTRVVL